jgi:hypothetical protein
MRHDTMIGIKVPRALALEIRRRAAEDDRTVSAYLRRLLSATLTERQEPREHGR